MWIFDFLGFRYRQGTHFYEARAHTKSFSILCDYIPKVRTILFRKIQHYWFFLYEIVHPLQLGKQGLNLLNICLTDIRPIDLGFVPLHRGLFLLLYGRNKFTIQLRQVELAQNGEGFVSSTFVDFKDNTFCNLLVEVQFLFKLDSDELS